jgi:glycosyltransferase involved in cell wall biosynthesis
MKTRNVAMPCVSVIIPTFNRAEFLIKAIESVLRQSYRDFELIVVDDGSTDQTAGALAPYQDRVQIVRQPNHGVSAARNAGISRASGEFLAFLDSDDQWQRHKLREQMALCRERPRTKICYTDEIWIRQGVRVNPCKKHAKYSGWIFEHALPLCIISPSSVMIHREIFEQVGLFDESMPACEDYDLWLRITLHHPVTFLPKPLIIKFGGHPDQLSHTCPSLDRFRIYALEKILAQPELCGEWRIKALAELQHKCRIYAEGCRRHGHGEEWQRYLEKMTQYQL